MALYKTAQVAFCKALHSYLDAFTIMGLKKSFGVKKNWVKNFEVKNILRFWQVLGLKRIMARKYGCVHINGVIEKFWVKNFEVKNILCF